MSENDCVFCRIVSGEMEGQGVFHLYAHMMGSERMGMP